MHRHSHCGTSFSIRLLSTFCCYTVLYSGIVDLSYGFLGFDNASTNETKNRDRERRWRQQSNWIHAQRSSRSCHATIILIIHHISWLVGGIKKCVHMARCRCDSLSLYTHIVRKCSEWMPKVSKWQNKTREKNVDEQSRAFIIRFNVCSFWTITDNFYRVCSHKETRFEFIFLLVLIIQFQSSLSLFLFPILVSFVRSLVGSFGFDVAAGICFTFEDITFRYIWRERTNANQWSRFFVFFSSLPFGRFISDFFFLFRFISNAGASSIFIFIIISYFRTSDILSRYRRRHVIQRNTKYMLFFLRGLCILHLFFTSPDCIVVRRIWRRSTASSF